jgi:hypothetical protein
MQIKGKKKGNLLPSTNFTNTELPVTISQNNWKVRK